jgi:hypothetical protein
VSEKVNGVPVRPVDSQVSLFGPHRPVRWSFGFKGSNRYVWWCVVWCGGVLNYLLSTFQALELITALSRLIPAISSRPGVQITVHDYHLGFFIYIFSMLRSP